MSRNFSIDQLFIFGGRPHPVTGRGFTLRDKDYFSCCIDVNKYDPMLNSEWCEYGYYICEAYEEYRKYILQILFEEKVGLGLGRDRIIVKNGKIHRIKKGKENENLCKNSREWHIRRWY